MRALVYGGGLTLLKAKRAVEAALDDGEVAVMLPHVPDRDALAKRLADAGFPSAFSTPSEPVEVKRLREGLSLTQEQFAVLYGIDLRTLQGYESGRSKPDQGTAAYLDLIRKAPEETRKLRLSFT